MTIGSFTNIPGPSFTLGDSTTNTFTKLFTGVYPASIAQWLTSRLLKYQGQGGFYGVLPQLTPGQLTVTVAQEDNLPLVIPILGTGAALKPVFDNYSLVIQNRAQAQPYTYPMNFADRNCAITIPASVIGTIYTQIQDILFGISAQDFEASCLFNTIIPTVMGTSVSLWDLQRMQTTKDYLAAVRSMHESRFGWRRSATPPIFCKLCHKEMLYTPYIYDVEFEYGLGYFYCFNVRQQCKRNIVKQSIEETFLGFDEK